MIPSLTAHLNSADIFERYELAVAGFIGGTPSRSAAAAASSGLRPRNCAFLLALAGILFNKAATCRQWSRATAWTGVSGGTNSPRNLRTTW